MILLCFAQLNSDKLDWRIFFLSTWENFFVLKKSSASSRDLIFFSFFRKSLASCFSIQNFLFLLKISENFCFLKTRSSWKISWCKFRRSGIDQATKTTERGAKNVSANAVEWRKCFSVRECRENLGAAKIEKAFFETDFLRLCWAGGKVYVLFLARLIFVAMLGKSRILHHPNELKLSLVARCLRDSPMTFITSRAKPFVN